jgi:hypothetical protein
MFIFYEGLLLFYFYYVYIGCRCGYYSIVVVGVSPVVGTALFCASIAFLVVWDGVFSSSTSVCFV